MPNLFEIKRQMVEVGKLMYRKGLVIAKHGNISYKISDNEFICTPGGLCKEFLTPDKLVRVDANGNSLEAGKKPTSEIRMHIEIYRLRPEINCIVHAQPAATTAFAISGIDAARFVLPGDKEAYFGLVPAEAYDKSNHDANTLAKYMSDKKKQAYVFHGDSSLSVGDTLYNAFDAVESLEHYCRISILARNINALECCSTEQLKQELDRRQSAPSTACCTGACSTCQAPCTASSDDAQVQEVVRRVIAALGN